MKRIPITNDPTPNFIGCWNTEDTNYCDEMIAFFENNHSLQSPGATGSGVNQEKKKSVDIAINPNDLSKPGYEVFKSYFSILQTLYLDYQEQWPFLKTFLSTVHIGSFNLQRYYPGDHFSNLHSERTHISKAHRVFAFMTYLNDVESGGTTDFHYYNAKVSPQKGKTLIWPAEWTHAHVGSVVEEGEKYIVTGWLHFPINS